MYSLRDGIYFGRLPNGHVRLLILPKPLRGEFPKIDQPYPDAVLDTAIDDGHWGSVVASVSVGGEAAGRWYTAMAFHNGVDPTACPTCATASSFCDANPCPQCKGTRKRVPGNATAERYCDQPGCTAVVPHRHVAGTT